MKNFQFIEKIGCGAFSKVYKVMRKSDDQIYALKKVNLINLNEKQIENTLNEVRFLASIQHKNIVEYKDSFIEDNQLLIVLEYISGGDLQKKILQMKEEDRYFTEQEVWDAIIQLAEGLNALHIYKIIHRDIKSANIFITENGEYKIGDLNISKQEKEGLVSTQLGTPYYAAPEKWRNDKYNQKCDIWSLGCVIYEMCTRKQAFEATDYMDLYNKVQKGQYERIPGFYSLKLSNLIQQCLQVNSFDRPSCKQILQIYKNTNNKFEKERRSSSMDSIQLLQTIKFNSNIEELKNKLPKSRYSAKVKNILLQKQQSDEYQDICSKRDHSNNPKSNINSSFLIKKKFSFTPYLIKDILHFNNNANNNDQIHVNPQQQRDMNNENQYQFQQQYQNPLTQRKKEKSFDRKINDQAIFSNKPVKVFFKNNHQRKLAVKLDKQKLQIQGNNIFKNFNYELPIQVQSNKIIKQKPSQQRILTENAEISNQPNQNIFFNNPDYNLNQFELQDLIQNDNNNINQNDKNDTIFQKKGYILLSNRKGSVNIKQKCLQLPPIIKNF